MDRIFEHGLFQNTANIDDTISEISNENKHDEQMTEQKNSNESEINLHESSQSKDSLEDILTVPSSLNDSVSIREKSHKGSCDDALMFVKTSDRPQKEKRYCCLYCRETFPKLMRHMEMKHKTESDVQKFIDLPIRKFLVAVVSYVNYFSFFY